MGTWSADQSLEHCNTMDKIITTINFNLPVHRPDPSATVLMLSALKAVMAIFLGNRREFEDSGRFCVLISWRERVTLLAALQHTQDVRQNTYMVASSLCLIPQINEAAMSFLLLHIFKFIPETGKPENHQQPD